MKILYNNRYYLLHNQVPDSMDFTFLILYNSYKQPNVAS